MRGLTMALLALDLPGHDGHHRAGRLGVPFPSGLDSSTTTAKTITKKTAKTV